MEKQLAIIHCRNHIECKWLENGGCDCECEKCIVPKEIMPVMTSPENKEWEKLFDEKYLDKNSPSGLNQKDFQSFPKLVKDIPSFIQKTISQAIREERERLRKEIIKIKESVEAWHGTNKYDSCYDDCLALITTPEDTSIGGSEFHAFTPDSPNY